METEQNTHCSKLNFRVKIKAIIIMCSLALLRFGIVDPREGYRFHNYVLVHVFTSLLRSSALGRVVGRVGPPNLNQFILHQGHLLCFINYCLLVF